MNLCRYLEYSFIVFPRKLIDDSNITVARDNQVVVFCDVFSMTTEFVSWYIDHSIQFKETVFNQLVDYYTQTTEIVSGSGSGIKWHEVRDLERRI